MILFLYGEDSFSSWKKLQVIQKRFLATQDANNLTTFTAHDLESQNLSDIMNAVSLWSGQRLIVLRDVLAEGSAELKDKLQAKLAGEIEPSLTIIVWESSKFDRRQSLYKLLNKPKLAEEFPIPSPRDLPGLVTKLANEAGIVLTPSQQRAIVAMSAGDLWLVHSELAKLASCPENLRDELISTSDQTATFALQDAIVNQNIAEVLQVLHKQLANGHDSTLLVGSLAATLRNLIRISDLLSRGSSATEVVSATKLHPFVARNLTPLALSRPQSEWRLLYRQLTELDWNIKIGAIAADDALDLAVSKLTRR